MTKSSISKNILQKNFTLPRRILSSLFSYPQLNYSLWNDLDITKQNLNYWINKLKKEGLIERPFHGFCQITEPGKKLIGGFEKDKNKSLVRLENMRFKYPIWRGVNTIISKLQNHKTQQLNNDVTVHHGTLNGFTARIFSSSTNPSIEITCEQKLGYDIYEMLYEARTDIEKMLLDVNNSQDIRLGVPESSMEPEWAISSPLAETVLSKTCSSQIRTSKGTINRSKGRNADLETRDIRLAQDIFQMPEWIKGISLNVEELKDKLLGKKPRFYEEISPFTGTIYRYSAYLQASFL